MTQYLRSEGVVRVIDVPSVTVDESRQRLEYAATPRALFVECPRGPWVERLSNSGDLLVPPPKNIQGELKSP